MEKGFQMTFDRMTRRIACGVAGIGIASVCAVGGVATAAPSAPAHPHSAPQAVSPDSKVPDTKCTLAQVERALAKQDPAVWQKIQSNPRVKRHFEAGITMTKEQRQAKMAKFKKAHPTESSVMNFLKDHHINRPEMKKAHDAVLKAKDTCGRY